MLKAWLEQRLKQYGWTRRDPELASLHHLDEMPRFPVRALVLIYLGIALAACTLFFYLVGNPLAAVRDARRATRYNQQPLTSLAAGPAHPAVWVGSEGGGIKVFDPEFHFWRDDVTHASSSGSLLGDHVLDLDLAPDGAPLAAIALASGAGRPGGVQLAGFKYEPGFWPKAVIDLSDFPGVCDTNASCVVATADQSRLAIGTRGYGLGIYHVQYHSWTDRITTKNGLPSDRVQDVETISSNPEQSVVWIATDRGLCGGWLDAAGRFSKQWLYTGEQDLAGPSVKHLVREHTNLWYVTDGGGLGRIRLLPDGAPWGRTAAEVVVTERRVPGLQDADLLLGRGSSVSRDTWFLADIRGRPVVGRHRERPYDTFGVLFPEKLTLAEVTCAATDPNTGQALFLGSTKGGYVFYTPASSLHHPTPPIAGGHVGPSDTRVLEATLAGRTVLAKVRGASGVAGLESAQFDERVPWSWASLVGTGRFNALASNRDITCAAGAGNRVYFGTTGKGIGLWDRERMEVRLERHSSATNKAHGLRSNTSLDLAMMNGTLVQVTQDYAVDCFPEAGRVALVPPDRAPVQAAEVITATGGGRWFACTDSDRVGVYDAGTFTWKTLPTLQGVTRLDFTRGWLWALTSQRRLFALSLKASNPEWRSILDGVVDLAVSLDSAHVLSRDSSGGVVMHTYSGEEGKRVSSLVPRPLSGGDRKWKFALVEGDDLWLLGGRGCLDHYDLRTRSWETLPFPESVPAPARAAVRSRRAWWFTDANRVLHRFDLGTRRFRVRLAEGVDRLDANPDGAIVLAGLGDGGSRRDVLSWHPETGADHLTLVGRPFEGNLSQIADAVESNGRLLVAEADRISEYNWSHHDWATYRSPVGSVSRFYQANDVVWAVCGAGREALHAWVGGELQPVRCPGEQPLNPARVVNEQGRLLVLDASGRLLRVEANAPIQAADVLLPSKCPGAWPDDAARVSALDGWLAVGVGEEVLFYGPFSGPGQWQNLGLGNPVRRLIASPGTQRLVVSGRDSAWVITSPSPSANRLKELTEGGETARRGSVAGVATSDSLSACVLEVPGESGQRVRLLGNAASEVREVLGAPCPTSAATKRVLPLPEAGLLRLDKAGRAANYSTRSHSWNSEPLAGTLENVWVASGSVIGFEKDPKCLTRRVGTGTWSREWPFSGRIQGVQAFPDGFVLALDDGGLGWYANGVAGLARNATGQPGLLRGFETVVEAAENSGLFVLLDRAGRLAAFHWPAQSWLQYKEGKVHGLRRAADGIYLVVDEAGKNALAGPLQQSEAGVTASVVPGTAGLSSVAVLNGELYCVTDREEIVRLVGGRLDTVWRKPDGPQVDAPGALLAAEKVGAEAWLVVSFKSNQTALLKIQSDTLQSTPVFLPQEQLRRVFRVSPAELGAVLVSSNGAYPCSLVSMKPMAPPRPDLEGFGVDGGAVLGISTQGLFRAVGGQWVALQETNAPVPEPERTRLLSTLDAGLGTLVVTQVPTAGWFHPTNPGLRVAVCFPREGGEVKLYPAADMFALAHERVLKITASKEALFGATPGGVLELTPRGSRLVKALHNQVVRQPLGPVEEVQWDTNLLCAVRGGRCYRLEAGQWRPSTAPDVAQREAARRDASGQHLTVWRLPAPTEDPRTLRRRFDSGQWRTVRLLPGGFDFESAVAAAWVSGRLEVYTLAGTLLFGTARTNWVPEDLLPTWPAPSELSRGAVFPGPDNRLYLSASGDPARGQQEPLWVREARDWRAATPAEKDALVRHASGPFLQDNEWVWHQPGPGRQSEAVSWKAAGVTTEGVFDWKSGRFDWDTCRALGQAQGQIWMVTHAGLFEVGAQGMKPQSRVPLPAPVQRLSFDDTSGDQPGALLDDNGQRLLIFEGAWKKPAEAGASLQKQLAEFRHTDKHWRVRRNGSVERSLQQSPELFAPTRLAANGQWDFETVLDVATKDSSVFLATRFGVVVLDPVSRAWKSFWPMPDVKEVGFVADRLVSDSGLGRQELQAQTWARSTWTGPLHPARATNQGSRFRLERRFPGVTLAVRPRGGDPFRSTSPGLGGFAFDRILDGAAAGNDVVATVTPEGLIERARNGDLSFVQLAGAASAASLRFFRVPLVESGSALYAGADGGGGYSHEGGWQPMAAQQTDAMRQLSQVLLANGSRWRVSTTNEGRVEFRVHLDEDPVGLLRVVAADPGQGGFGIDRFTCLAVPDGAGRLMVGSEGGLQRLDAAGQLRRFWNNAEHEGRPVDGLATVAVTSIVRDASGSVQLLANGKYFEIPPTNDLAQTSAKERLDRAFALKASDPEGWRVEINRQAGLPLQTTWKGEPVFLVDLGAVGARFAHNIVQAALGVAGQLWLSTEGGLLVLPSADADSIPRMRLTVRPFLARGSAGPSVRPVAFGWLGLDAAEAGRVLAWPVNKADGPWRLPVQDPGSSAPMPANEVCRPQPGGADDLLVWHHPEAGRVEVVFAPGRVFPEDTVPQISNGTFTFLDLDVPRSAGSGDSLMAGTNRVFWAARGGVLEFDPGSRVLVRLYAASATSGEPLSDTQWLYCHPTNHVLLAGRGDARFQFDPSAGQWKPLEVSGGHLEDRELVNATPRLEWRHEGRKLRARLRQTDNPGAALFNNGKLAVDEVLDVVCVPRTNGNVLMIGSSGGVAEHREADLEHLQVQAAAFRSPTEAPVAVVELARSVTSDKDLRVCARTRDRSTFELLGGRWENRTDLASVFALSYRRVVQTNQWIWSRFPSGLGVEMRNVNGPAVHLGQGVDPSRLPIFARGKMAIDDARCVALVDHALLVGTALGVAHFGVDRKNARTDFIGLDIYSAGENGVQTATLTNVVGFLREEGLFAWNPAQIFATGRAIDRSWSRSRQSPASWMTQRWLRNGRESWEVCAPGIAAAELKVTLQQGNSTRSWYVPAPTNRLCDVADSKAGPWILTEHGLYHVNQERLSRSWRR
jgi:hypothetical protein